MAKFHFEYLFSLSSSEVVIMRPLFFVIEIEGNPLHGGYKSSIFILFSYMYVVFS